ncbi:MAG TPA: ATP-dependent DNA helicase [Candidatus Angelobacter sp.]
MAKTFIPNAKQKQAIEHIHGPMLVLAGAGTGKTSVLVERIAWLIENGHAAPEEILAITFTDNAAAEMKERVASRLRRKTAISAATFNAYCQGILKRNRRDFSVLIPEDVYVFLRQNIEKLELERFIKPADVGEFLYDLRTFFDRCHEELVEPKDFQQYIDTLQPGPDLPRNCRSKDIDKVGPQEIINRWQEIARVYSNAMRLLEEENLGTFGMQISRAVRLLLNDANLLVRERKRARFILVDEFQDCNSSNIILTQLIAGDEKNIFAVGDPDQAIYRFRGASSAAFEEFQKRFPQTRRVTLDENQRSRGNILRVAFAAISQNPDISSGRADLHFRRSPLQSARDLRDQQSGRLVFDDPVEVAISSSDAREAADIAEEIVHLQMARSPREPYSMAVLYRSHFNREKLMEELAARDIPFMVKGMDVLDTAVVRDLLAVARAVANDADAESLFRMCAFPQFAMDAKELREKLSGAANKSTFRAILNNLDGGNRILAAVESARNFIAQQKITVGGIFDYLVREFELPSDDPALKALLRFIGEWEQKPYTHDKSLPAFLQYVEYFDEAGGVVPLLTEEQLEQAAIENPDAVQLMTVHGAKGLEFSHVWVLRVTSPSFPTQYRESLFEFPPALRRCIAIGDGKEINEQEERRLFYVAITRARDRLTLCSRPGRGQDPTPPGFLRPLLQNRTLNSSLRKRDARHAPMAPGPFTQVSTMASWMLLSPAFVTSEVTLSANAVESYSTCPLKFKLERDWRIPGDASAAMQFGNAVHTVLKNYYDPSPIVPQQSVADVVTAFRHEFAKAMIEDAVQRQLYEEQGRRHLERLVTSKPRGSMEVIAAELRFDFTLGKLKITGRIDRMDRIEGNCVRVIDYKTGKPWNQKDADDSLQLSIYAMGAAELKYAARELVLLNVRGNEEIVTGRTPAQLERARRRIEEAAEGIAAGEFDPRPGLHCKWCAFARLCPATEQRVLVPLRALTAGVDA